MKKIFLLLVVFFCMFSVYSSGNLTVNQETVLISNLNYLQYSISKIKNTDSRAVVDSEYSSIINNLDYSSLNVNKNDKSLEDYYQQFLNECTLIILNDNEKEFLKEVNKKETEKFRKKVDKSYKSAGLVKTNAEKENRVRAYLSKAISVDTQNLSSIYGKVADEFYNSDYDLFNSKFAIYDNDSFIIGLKSIYLSSIDKTATFNSIGDVILSEN